VLVNQTTGQVLATQLRPCDTFWTKLRGLMFRRSLDPDEALVFCYARESIAGTSIHMFFVPFPIAAIWLDAEKRVVDQVLAKPFRPYYASRAPARYLVEGVPELLSRARIGDVLTFEECGR
jgi:uncharacterized membrane protein (UPF0127 family)